MRADVDLTGQAPSLIVFVERAHIIICCEQIEQTGRGPKPNGKHVHLGMTAADAMLLLAQLKEAQARLGLPDNSALIREIPISPAKFRN
jgi:hypothetical protein